MNFFVGENGSGKSTLLEAIAVSLGFNTEGGSKNFSFDTRRSHSELHEYLLIAKGLGRPPDGYLLRAERFFNVATEIEAALSPQRQLATLVHMRDLMEENSQFIIATHSPILMAYPDATIFHCGKDGIKQIAYQDTEHYRVTRDFLMDPQRMLGQLFAR